jgi:hypothetical protein
MRAFSATVRLGQRESSWNTQRMPCDCAAAAFHLAVIFAPPTDNSPADGVRFPLSTCMRVDLPAPLWPTSPKHSPAATTRSTPPKARTAPKDFSTPSSLIASEDK